MLAVIAGSTGLTGSKVLHLLANDPAFVRVIALTRRPLDLQHPKIEERIITDFQNISNVLSIPKGATFFCALGTTIKKSGSRIAFRSVDFDAVLQFGLLAKKNEAKAFIAISAAGANPHSQIFYNQVKGETEQALCSLAIPSTVILRPGLLIGDRHESRPAERIGIMVARALPGRWIRRIATGVDTLAEKMVAEAKNPSPGIKVIEARELG
ncbi:MAG: hypothetical protein KGP28_13285 [Bdellovibrionales bacterium]|nr:hypothetical protein [Bdellovibrionales bacterium]